MQKIKDDIKCIHIGAGFRANSKEEKGSVAVVVIVAILFIVALSTTIYFSAVNRRNTGSQAAETIKQAYEKDINNMDELYATYQENGLYIYTKEDLEKFRDRVNSGVSFEGKTVYLMNNINLNIGNYTENEDGTITFSENATQWEPIGNSTYAFEGIFEGNGYEISGLYINDTTKSYQGLFGKVENATIQNLGINNSKIIAKRYIGGITGYNDYGDIINCYNLANIESVGNITSETNTESRTGGIVGVNRGTIENCYNGGEIKGIGNHIGGIAGFNGSEAVVYGYIRNCYNFGNITEGKYGVGGIVGTNYIGITEKCYNEGNIIIEEAMAIGGIAGVNNAKINDIYNIGSITVTNCEKVGGIVGYMGINDYGDSILSNSYNVGNMQGNGSIVGNRNGSDIIVNNYYLEELNLGGINNSDITGSAEPRTSEFMKSQDFVELLGVDNWMIQEGKNNGYPILR